MKHTSSPTQLSLRVSATALTVLLLGSLVQAQTTYYWDSNGATSGFGNSTGSWGTDAFWSTDAAGTSATSNPSITTSDTVNFGTAALNYANPTVTGPSSAQGFQNMNFGAGQTTALSISGGTLNLAANSTITQSSTSANMTIGSVLQGSGSALTKTGSGALTLSGNNTFTGGVTLTGNGALNLARSSAAGTGTIFLKSTQTSFPTTLGISGGTTVANAIQIDSTTGRETIASTGTGNTALTGGITVTGAGNTFMAISNEQSSGNLTISGGITATGNFTGGFGLRGSLAGNSGFFNGVVNTPGSSTYFGINGATTWTINTAGSNYGSFSIATTGGARLGVDNAIATNAYVSWSANSTTGALDLNGYNQSVAGLDANYAANGNNTVTNNGTVNSVLTLAGLTTNRTFAGVIKDGATNKVSLVMNSAGQQQTLSGINTYTGDTTVSNGTLFLSNDAQLLFTIGASGVNNQINGSGKLDLYGDFNFNLTGAAGVGSWTIVNVGTLTESFGSSFTVVGFTDAGSNIWTRDYAGSTYTFSESTGVLTAAVPEPSTWVLLALSLLVVVTLRRRRLV
jgi:autotransporter-associated beta strand protein